MHISQFATCGSQEQKVIDWRPVKRVCAGNKSLLTHIHKHTHTRLRQVYAEHTHTLSLSVSLSLSRARARALSLSLTHTHTHGVVRAMEEDKNREKRLLRVCPDVEKPSLSHHPLRIKVKVVNKRRSRKKEKKNVAVASPAAHT